MYIVKSLKTPKMSTRHLSKKKGIHAVMGKELRKIHRVALDHSLGRPRQAEPQQEV